mgnify:CR=1 FL=1
MVRDIREQAAGEWDAKDITALVDFCGDFVQVMRSDAGCTEETFRTFLDSAAAEINRLSNMILVNHNTDYEDAKLELRAPVA